ncbi:MAG: hypothetical protein VX733_02625 [Candidatus Latescibacterota bacterium]|nr:hypothetical protein [Candidatus Latescibacterota bacterium]
MSVDIVQVGGSAHHQNSLTPFAGIPIQMTCRWHLPLMVSLRPAHEHPTATPTKVTSPDVVHGRLQEIAEEWIWLEALDSIWPLVRFVDRTAKMSPELILPL